MYISDYKFIFKQNQPIKEKQMAQTKRLKVSIVASLFLLSSSHAFGASMEGLGDLSGGVFESTGFGVSGDGSVIVGYSKSTNGEEAFLWTQADGMVGLGFLTDGTYSGALGVNLDGTVIVGYSDSTDGDQAFRWTQADGMVGLGDLAGGSYESYAYGVSANGSVVAGYSDSTDGYQAFRWTQADGMVGLGDLAGGSYESYAYGVSADGSVVVGESMSTDGLEAFRWTETDGMIGLGDLAGGTFHSTALAVNPDGSVVVGSSKSDNGFEAFRWTQSSGMQSLVEWFAEDGFTLTGWSATSAQGVSDDGNTIVGYGTSANGKEAFIAKAGQGMIGLDDFTTSLESINTVSSQSISNVSTLLNGAHGHPGNRRAIDDKRVMWIAGDISSDNRHGTKDDGYIGEIGISIKQSEQFTYSIAIGKIFGDSELEYKGTIDSNGEYIIADTDIQPFKNIPLYSTTTLAYGKNDLEVKRGYDNAGTLTYSTGDTKQSFFAFKQRLQYQFETLFPYVQLNYIRVNTDGYTETGGGFPAIYDKSKENVTDWRAGFDANFKLNDSNTLITTLEAVHRAEDSGKGVSGQIVGLGSFSIDGREYDQNWLRATLGLEHSFENRSKFTITFNRTTEGEDTVFWSGFNYSMPF